MEIFNYKYNKTTEIVALGDLHVGSSECDIDFIKKTIEKIRKRKTRCLLMGDLADVGLRSSPGASVYENTMNPKEQLELLVELLKPIRKNILGAVVGNHSWRIEKETGICFLKILCDNLDIPYGKFQMFHNITVGKEKYEIFAMHGASNAMSTEGRINAFKKQFDNIDSELYLFGHTHDLFKREFDRRVVKNGKVTEEKKIIVLCGNALNYGGYAEFKGYPVLKKGFPLIRLHSKTHKIEVDLEW
jgi:predicted phosphodiesterase